MLHYGNQPLILTTHAAALLRSATARNPSAPSIPCSWPGSNSRLPPPTPAPSPLCQVDEFKDFPGHSIWPALYREQLGSCHSASCAVATGLCQRQCHSLPFTCILTFISQSMTYVYTIQQVVSDCLLCRTTGTADCLQQYQVQFNQRVAGRDSRYSVLLTVCAVLRQLQ
jgi:hypothetical protein